MTRLWLTLCGLLLGSLLAGCGSSAAPDFTISCRSHVLQSGAVRARLSVTNHTGAPARVILYGPAFSALRHIQPVLAPTRVLVQVGGSKRSYFGYVVPVVRSKHPFHEIMRFAPDAQRRPILVTRTAVVHLDHWPSRGDSGCAV